MVKNNDYLYEEIVTSRGGRNFLRLRNVSLVVGAGVILLGLTYFRWLSSGNGDTSSLYSRLLFSSSLIFAYLVVSFLFSLRKIEYRLTRGNLMVKAGFSRRDYAIADVLGAEVVELSGSGKGNRVWAKMTDGRRVPIAVVAAQLSFFSGAFGWGRSVAVFFKDGRKPIALESDNPEIFVEQINLAAKSLLR